MTPISKMVSACVIGMSMLAFMAACLQARDMEKQKPDRMSINCPVPGAQPPECVNLQATDGGQVIADCTDRALFKPPTFEAAYVEKGNCFARDLPDAGSYQVKDLYCSLMVSIALSSNGRCGALNPKDFRP